MVVTTGVDGSCHGSDRSVIERYFRTWNDGDVDILPGLLTPDWFDHAHPERRSVHELQRAIQEAREREPGTRTLMDTVLPDGDLITVNGRIVGPDRTESLLWIVRMQEGKMKEMWTHRTD